MNSGQETWVITGGAGFIGANFVHLAHEHSDANLVILDALTYAGDMTRMTKLLESPRVHFEKCDIVDAHAVNTVFEKHKPTQVIHFAAESHVDRSILGPTAFIKSNIEGTANLLMAAQATWNGAWDNHRFIHVSTDEVYGTLAPEDPPFSEESQYAPNSPYAASKAASDHLVRAWHQTYGLPAIITNCCNNYGPWQFPEKLIPLFVSNAVEEKALPVYGDGMQIREWLHVDDHCEAILTVLNNGIPGEVYLIGGGAELPNIEIIQEICKSVDQLLERPQGKTAELITYVEDRLGHDRRYAISGDKILKELGWKAKRPFSEGLYDTVKWYLDNATWVNNAKSGTYRDFYESQYKNRLDGVKPAS
jgi:dTDP-glucose 4,6-dehydratase